MELMQTVKDSFAHLEELGMRRRACGPRATYSYPSLPGKGQIQVLGDIGRYYFVCADYHILTETVQPYRMDEPWIEIGSLEEIHNFVSREGLDGPEIEMPLGVSFTVVRPTGAVGCIYCGRDTYCRGSSLILRHATCARYLFPMVRRVFGREADAYSIIQLAGETCLPQFAGVLAGLKSCAYNGEAAQLYLDGKASEVLAALAHAIETLDMRKVPQFTAFERQAVLDAQQQLRAAVQNPPSLRVLARKVGLNPNKLQAAFRYYSGATVMDYLRVHRMQLALELLSTDMLLDEVARQVGYRSASRFSEAFAKSHGILPSKYRKMIVRRTGGAKENSLSA